MRAPRVQLHVVLLGAIAVGAAAILGSAAWPEDPYRASSFAGLTLAAFALGAFDPWRSRTDAVMPPSFVVDFTSLLVVGPLATMVVITARAAAGYLVGAARWPSRAILVNFVTGVVATQAAGLALAALSGTSPHFAWPWQSLPVAGAVAAYCFVTSGLAECLTPRAMRSPAERSWPKSALRGCSTYVIGATVAVAIVELINRHAWDVLPVVAVPLYFVYRAYGAYVETTEDAARHRNDIEVRALEHTRVERALRRRTEQLELAAEGANDGLWEWDVHTDAFYVSARGRAMLDLSPDEWTGRREEWFARVHADDLAPLKQALERHLSGETDRFQHEHRLRHEDGAYRRVLCQGIAVRRAGRRSTRIAGSLTDTTERAIAQERIRSAGSQDPLTGLSNRSDFVDGVGRRLAELEARRGGHFAVLYLDLDRFKIVNDSLGHLVGDELLSAVSRRLETCLRPGDALARLGGDEFAILLNGLGDVTQANAIAFRIQDALGAPFSIGGREVFTSASIGIACSRTEYTNPEQIMRDADTAMYHAKAHGKARHELFDADMHARELDRLGLENDLRHAVQDNAFEVHYQPIVSLSSRMCTGFEALVRWTRNGKPVSPVDFIPAAEELGLIDRLGKWVLEEACRTFAAWRRQFPASGLDCITVNVSARQLIQQGFAYTVEQAIHHAGLKPCDVRLEITETALMEGPHLAAEVLRDLRNFGVKIYLDDFGTGYSSLSHLHKLPVDALKIDRSFVRSLLLDDRPAIVESILALARTLHTSVVAEGVESEEQARELERLGCTQAQGFYFSPPLPRASIEKLLAAHHVYGREALPTSA